MRTAARQDDNQKDLVARLVTHGWLVKDMSRMGKGWFDAVAVKGSRVVWLEIKNPARYGKQRQPNPQQVDLHDQFRRAGAEVAVVATVADLAQFERPL